jgi:hypothetical protein
MPKSYRIRTSVNQGQETDKEIRVQVDQDFDFLEILSLKLTQSEVYQRFCSDYGVIVGRVVANGGYGVPNARVSVFVPIDDIDLNNPVISTLYPYRAPSEKNEDGYRYNLLPYEPSYSGHSATGTFPSRNDVMTRKEVLHIYEKYYKYTVRTNESGDYMIVGVPLGNQQIVMDLDLSDMGCFSLRPTDLIRMNVGIPEQFNGNEFKTSEDLDSLPQILNLRKTAFISPFWGVGDACDIGINRMDFDLRDANIDIQPTSTFMGSIFTSSDTTFLKENCKPATEQGDLCGLTTGSGRILAVRQTIDRNSNGLPILEEFKLESGGKVIDDDGTFVVDVPMNLDYVVTDEFGQLVFSNDPKVGIPTKGKYRFKVKFNDSEKDLATTTFNPNSVLPTQVFNLSAFRPKGNLLRANYLIPNIKEYGWENGDPNTVENSQGIITEINFNNSEETEEIITTLPANTVGRIEVKSKEDFDNIQIYIDDVLDNSKWIEAQDRTQSAVLKIIVKKKTRKKVSGNSVVTEPIPVVLNFVRYNYSFVQFQKSYSFSLDWDDYPSIDDALNCNDTFYEFNYNKVYTTAQLIDEYRNGTARARFLSIKEILERSCESEVNKFPINDGVRNFDLLYFIISILFLINSISLPILIIVYDILKILWEYVIKFLVFILVYIISFIVDIVGFISYLFSPSFARRVRGISRDIRNFASSILNYQFPAIKLPMITYPDCSTCDCGSDNFATGGNYVEANQSVLSDVNTPTIYVRNPEIDGLTNDKDQYEQEYFNELYGQLSAGRSDADSNEWGRTPKYVSSDDVIRGWSTGYLPIPERINMFNGKGKYFTTEVAGGFNRIKVYPNYSNNNVSIIPTNPQYQFYEDQPYVTLIDPSVISVMSAGTMFSFIDPLTSKDINVSGNTIVTGTTPTTSNITRTISYANPSNPNEEISKIFNLSNEYTGNTQQYIFASDIEYYQVITATTIGEMETIIGGNSYDNNGFYRRIINAYLLPTGNIKDFNDESERNNFTLFGNNEPIKAIPNYKDIAILILMRGVDPYSTRQRTKIDISPTMGLSYGSIIVEGDYKLNKPITSGLSLVKHNELTSNSDIYHPSLFYTPSVNSYQGYSSYTTNLHTYYSSYDFTTDGNGVSSEKIGNNAGGYYKSVLNTTGRWKTNKIVSGLDGYYDSEYCEGVSLMTNMYQEPTNRDSFKDGGFFKFESKVYETGSTINMLSNSNIIMRTDRLPRSDQFDDNYIFNQNKNFATYIINDNGSSVSLISVSSTSDFSTSQSGDFQDVYGTGTTQVLTSFSCNTMVPLEAYNPQLDGQTITVKPSSDPVYYIDGDTNYLKMENGCYIISEKLFAIGEDLKQFAEWKSRFLLNFAICRNVFGMTFTNQWVNGGLYLPGFQNDVIYPGIEVTNPTYNYCRDKIVFRIENNSFFYRSSPYNGLFVGMLADKQSNIFGTQQGNDYFLGSPTTIVDLGPKDEIIQNVCAQPQFQGYGMNTLLPSTFNSPGDLLQLLIISRLSNSKFLQRIFTLGSASVGQFFSRDDGQKIDGDFAQLVSINSELGVTPFTPEGYSNSSLFYGQSTDPVIGVYFTANTQTRDFISPGRTTFIDTSTKFGYNTYGHKTQTVPMYKWSKQNANNFFGGENNNWKTDPPFYNIGYQNIDRLNDDTYFPSNIKNPTTQRPGYIYNSTPSSDSNGNITGFTYNAFDVPQGSNDFIVGAPFHFYFGLKKGRTAFDKFLKNNLIE